MQNTIKILVDLKKEVYRFDQAQQGDDVILDITLLENGVAKDLTGETVELIYINANNTVASVTGDKIAVSGNNVKITCPTDCTRSYGIAKFQLKIISTYQVSTFPIALTIVPSVDQNQQISQNISTILEDLTAKNIECGETLESISTGNLLNADLESNIGTGTLLNTDLEDNIYTVTQLQTVLSNTINTGNELDTSLDEKISVGNTLDATLKTDTETANTAKENLENVIATADTTTYATQRQVTEINSHLAEKANEKDVRFKDIPITLNDADSEMLAAIEGGEGTSFNLLSIPREKSVGLLETKYPMAEGIPSKNLFITEWEIGGFYSATGLPWDGTTQIRTKDYIPIKPSTQYVISDPERITSTSANAQYVFSYDSSKNFISKTEIRPNTTATYTTSSETYFIKLQSQSVGVQDYVIGDYANFKTQIEVGEMFTGYETPLPKISTENIKPKSITNELLADDVSMGVEPTEEGLPSYYSDEKVRVIEKVYNDITSPKNAVFGLIADIQGDTGQEQNKNLLEHYTNINYLCKDVPVSFIANLGDFINGVSPKATTLKELKKYTSLVVNTTPVPYFITKGNHDDNSAYTMNNGNPFDELITGDEWYNYVIRYFERYPQFVFDENNRQGGYCYYDDPISKVRFIFVNTYETAYIENADGTSKYDAMHDPAISDKQIQWLAHKAFNFMDKPDKEEWATLAFAHYVHGATKNYSLLINIINAYNNGTSYTGSTTDEDYASSVSVDFTSQGVGEFITFICGDNHRDIDFINLLYDINLFCVQSSYYPVPGEIREIKTATQDSFNIVVIDRENKLIKLSRFGGGEDRVMNYGDYTPKHSV